AAGDKTASYRCIGDIGKSSPIDVRRGYFQHSTIKGAFQEVKVTEAYLRCRGINRKVRCVQTLVAHNCGIVDKSVVRRRIRSGSRGHPQYSVWVYCVGRYPARGQGRRGYPIEIL